MSHADGRLDWDLDGVDWPHRSRSQFVRSEGVEWHVQRFAREDRPTVLLLHGTAASSHSWRTLAPELARDFDVIAPDLPGHGFTGRVPDTAMSLPAIAAAVAALMRTMGANPALIAGHSAGAAIALQTTVAATLRPAGIVGINGAWVPLHGLPGRLMPGAARLLAGPARPWSGPLIARLTAGGGLVDRLLLGTGSRIDEDGRRIYRLLLANPGHVAGTLAMMARWDLRPLWQALPALATALLLIVGSHDRTVPPAQSFAVAERAGRADLRVLAGLGHLAHEEDAGSVAREIIGFGARLGVLPPDGSPPSAVV